jgi:hypothetical protein
MQPTSLYGTAAIVFCLLFLIGSWRGSGKKLVKERCKLFLGPAHNKSEPAHFALVSVTVLQTRC